MLCYRWCIIFCFILNIFFKYFKIFFKKKIYILVGKCLSMHQPWASLLVCGIKKYVHAVCVCIACFVLWLHVLDVAQGLKAAVGIQLIVVVCGSQPLQSNLTKKASTKWKHFTVLWVRKLLCWWNADLLPPSSSTTILSHHPQPSSWPSHWLSCNFIFTNRRKVAFSSTLSIRMSAGLCWYCGLFITRGI